VEQGEPRQHRAIRIAPAVRPGRTIVLLALVTLAACAPVQQAERGPTVAWRVLPGPTVVAIAGRAVQIEFRPAADPPPGTSLAERVASEIARIAYLAPGTEVTLDGVAGRVTRVAGPTAEIMLTSDPGDLRLGASPTLVAANRVLALRDFDVPGRADQEEAKAFMEEVTTLLARTGQFRLVERLKLEAVIHELKFSLGDLASPDGAKKIGELLGAETIVTGSLVRRGSTVTANVRLINARTGEIFNGVVTGATIEALSRTPQVTRANFDGSFETKQLDETGWDFGHEQRGLTGVGGYQVIEVDSSDGAAGTHRSLRLRFRFGHPTEPGSAAVVRNSIRRDVSGFKGISFYLRTSRPLSVGLQFISGDDTPQVTQWRTFVRADSEWRRYQVGFDQLFLARARRENLSGSLDLSRVSKVMFFVSKTRNSDVDEATLWIDEVTFY
jgi:TolB-like protein